MSFLWKAIGGVLGAGGSIPNFPFSIGPILDTHRTATLTWTVHQGTRDEDRSPVTIFSCDMSEKSEFPTNTDAASKDLARNALKRAKLLMLPGLLRCYEAVEYNQIVYIATEECRPLTTILQDPVLRGEYYESNAEDNTKGASLLDINSECVQDNVALGLKHITQALIAMHKHQLQHGNVCHESVFVVRSGEWRLFGHEYVGDWKDENSLYRRLWSLLPEYRRPPETLSNASGPFHAVCSVDSWGLGALIFAVFSFISGKQGLEVLKNVKTAEIRAFRQMPRALQSGFVGITGANPKLRMPLDKFLSETEFICGSVFVNALQQLEELALKDAADRDTLYRQLTSSVDTFPLRACKYLILTKLNHAVTYSGGGSATALEPILKIGARLTDPADFAELVAPVVMTLFNSPDRTVRMRLLTSAGQYARLLPAVLVNEKIWPLFQSGFSSPDANLREHTVRALVHFAPLLQEKTLSTEALRYITALQQDREGPIRTNATICLCLIASHLGEAARSKALVHGFGRMLKDPFLPSRMAALKSIGTTMGLIQSSMLAEALAPAIVPLTLDAAQEVREKAMEVMEAVLKTLRVAAAELTEKQMQQQAANPSVAVDSNIGAMQQPSGTPVSSSTSFLGQWGWGSSANLSTPTTADTTAAQQQPRTSSSPPPPPVVTSSGSSGSFAQKNVTAATVKSESNNANKNDGWDDEQEDMLEEDDWDNTSTKKASFGTKTSLGSSSSGGIVRKPLTLGGATRPATAGAEGGGSAVKAVIKKKGFGGATKAD